MTIAQTSVYQHSSSPHWGRAILAYERRTKRAYQFEDGKLRLFKEGFYHLLEPLPDLDEREAAKVRSALTRKLDLQLEQRAQSRPAGPKTNRGLTDQRQILDKLYPEGLAGPSWADDHRGSLTGRALKRHRAPAIMAMNEALGDGRHADLSDIELVDAWHNVLRKTDLVKAPRRKLLGELPDADKARVGAAMRDLLDSDETFGLLFERFVATVSLVAPKVASWSLLTSFMGLLKPSEHVVVRPTAMQRQAALLAPDLVHQRSVNAPLYLKYCALAGTVRDELLVAGQTPRDLLDVVDFMRVTLRPKAQALLERS